MTLKMIYRRPFTLLEMLIAMALTILVMATMTYFYQQVSLIGNEVDRLKTEEFYMRYLENRLSYILPRIVPPNDAESALLSVGDEGITKPGSQSLIFTFDNGPSLSKEISNNVIARIYLDRNNRLMLAYWPTPKHIETFGGEPMIKKEVLFEGADSLAFEFFVAPDKGRRDDTKKKGGGVEPEQKGDWRKDLWVKEFKELPAIIKVIITLPPNVAHLSNAFLNTYDGKSSLVFAFPIMNKKTPHIVYE